MDKTRWLMPNFKIKFYPDSFSPEIEKTVRDLIWEVNERHPFWDEPNHLRVDEVLIFTDNRDLSGEASIEWRSNFKIILLELGMARMIKKELWNSENEEIEELLFDRENLSTEILDTDGLRSWLFHEFSHPLDEANPKFLFRKFPVLSWLQSSFVMWLWNGHIDGRLARKGIQPIFNLVERFSEMLDLSALEKAGCTKEKIFQSIYAAWEADFMTYQEMIDCARENIPFAVDDKSLFSPQ